MTPGVEMKSSMTRLKMRGYQSLVHGSRYGSGLFDFWMLQQERSL